MSAGAEPARWPWPRAFVVAVLLWLVSSGTALAQEPGPAVIVFGDELAATGLSIVAYVDGARCDEADLTVDRVLELGLPEQPEACGREGATITLYANTSPGRVCPSDCAAPHSEPLFVRRGETQQLDVFSPAPPASGSSVNPPGTGSLGETGATGGSGPRLALAGLFAVLTVIGARTATRQADTD